MKRRLEIINVPSLNKIDIVPAGNLVFKLTKSAEGAMEYSVMGSFDEIHKALEEYRIKHNPNFFSSKE